MTKLITAVAANNSQRPAGTEEERLKRSSVVALAAMTIEIAKRTNAGFMRRFRSPEPAEYTLRRFRRGANTSRPAKFGTDVAIIMHGYPLDLQSVSYSYLERPNCGILWLLRNRGLLKKTPLTILDIGCGCGANARSILNAQPSARIIGIEPDPRAADLASDVCERVLQVSVEAGLSSDWEIPPVDVVLLSDVLEHIADPVAWLRAIVARPGLRDAVWIISVPNYAVWYNRLRTLFGRFEYQWSGLYDRTHLRFYTLRSIRTLLDYCGFEIAGVRCTPSIAQSAAQLIRGSFSSDVIAGNHLALLDSPAFRLYQRFIEPIEAAVCNVWKGLLGFQIVVMARPRKDGR